MAEDSTILMGVRTEPIGNAPPGKVYVWVDSSGVVWTKDDAGNIKSAVGVTVHNDLTGKNDADQHIISSVTGLQTSLDGKIDTTDGTAKNTFLLVDSDDNLYGAFSKSLEGACNIHAGTALINDAPATIISSAVGFEGYVLTVGQNGLVTYTKPVIAPNDLVANNAGPINVTSNIATDLGVQVTLVKDFTDPTFEWGVTFENDENATATVILKMKIDGVPQGSGIEYEVARNETSQLQGSYPYSGVVTIGKIIELELTSTRDGFATSIYTKLSVSGNALVAEWGSITGILSNQTDLQTALDLRQVKNNPLVSGEMTFDNGSGTYGILKEATGNHFELNAPNAISFNTNAMIIPSAVDFAGFYLTIGENGLITFTKPSETPEAQEDTNAGPVNSTGVSVDLGINITLLEDFTDATVQWSVTFENTYNFATSSVSLQGMVNGSPEGPAHNYEVGSGSTAQLTGSLPVIGTMSAGSVLTFQCTSSRSGIATDITVSIIAAGTSVTAQWGQITGTLSNQTDLQLALDGKADASTVNVFGTYAGNDERRDIVTNSSTTPVIYLSNTVTAAPAGRYRVGATVGWALNTASRNIIISWKMNGVIFGEMEVEPKDAGGDIKHINSGFDYIDHTGGDILLEMEFAPEQSGDVATVFNAGLEQWRVS